MIQTRFLHWDRTQEFKVAGVDSILEVEHRLHLLLLPNLLQQDFHLDRVRLQQQRLLQVYFSLLNLSQVTNFTFKKISIYLDEVLSEKFTTCIL